LSKGASVFSIKPSEPDMKLCKRMEDLQSLPLAYFDVKEEFYHEKLEKLAITGIVLVYYRV